MLNIPAYSICIWSQGLPRTMNRYLRYICMTKSLACVSLAKQRHRLPSGRISEALLRNLGNVPLQFKKEISVSSLPSAFEDSKMLMSSLRGLCNSFEHFPHSVQLFAFISNTQGGETFRAYIFTHIHNDFFKTNTYR